ncbi:FUSC family protein [Kribbella sp. NPDC004536]|uniref:FUSC family protein n=1 Tax=Kribbella sp. NPDC004536 TaxID=3364106 RepID=UPI0036B7A97E
MTVNVIHWSRETPVPSARLLTAALAMAVPITYGFATDHLPQASFAALGALALAAPPVGHSATAVRLTRLVATGLVVTAAAALGALVGGRGWTAVVVLVGLAAVAAVVGGFNRWMADATTRFVTFLVMATGFGGADVWQVTRWFAAGALWAILLSLFTPAPTPAPRATYRQLARRWWRTLHRFDGWQYAVQLLPPLAVASVIGVYWHQQKSYWIALAVVIVVRRRGDSLLRATERSLGTFAGVLIGGALVLWVSPSWVIVAVVSVLAGLRPLLKERNYTAYATIMTPLVVLLMDLGRTPELSTVGYRLIDTVLGCLLAIVPTLMLRRRNVA